MKLIVELQSISQIKAYKAVSGWLIGVNHLSSQAPAFFQIDEIKTIIEQAKNNGQFVVINANKIFNDSELSKVEKILDELKSLDIKYYFYTDFGFYQLAKARNLPLVYQASTYLTNSLDVNLFLLDNESVVVAPEVSFDELKQITNKANKSVMIEAFGRLTIFYSKRKLLSNYFQYRSWDNDSTHQGYALVEENRSEYYPIEENDSGTSIFSSAFYYLWDEINELTNVEALLIRTKWLNPDLFDSLITTYERFLTEKEGDIKNLGIELFQGALYRKSLLTKVR